MRVNKTKEFVEEVEVDYPLYCEVISFDDNIKYARFTKKDVTYIKINQFIREVEITYYERNEDESIGESWWDGRCSKEDWDGAVKYAKETVDKL